MVHEDVAGTDRGEHVGRLVVVGRQQAGRRDRGPERRLEVGPVQVGDLPQSGQVEHAADFVAVAVFEVQAAQQQAARCGRHGSLDLETDRLAEAPAAELLLDGQQQVVGLVLLEGEVGVAGDPEEVVLFDDPSR